MLYVSPLKALAVDVERNLRAPLTGIRQASARLGAAAAGHHRRHAHRRHAGRRAPRASPARPPDILITTPESLFLLLTSAARESLRGVETVIIDEVHAVAATKRGAHLALSLERLDALLPPPGAADRPVRDGAADRRDRPVPRRRRAGRDRRSRRAAKTIEVTVEVPVEDMTRLDEVPERRRRRPGAGRHAPSIWPAVEERVLDLIQAHRSTIVFTNSRRGAERLCARINELAAERRRR